MDKSDRTAARFFGFFTEINIIGQLSSRLLERALPDGFLISHFGVLNHLIRLGDGSTPLQLAQAFQVPKTTMTHTLSGLEKAKLVRFESNPADGRSKLVVLTDKGRAFHEQAIENLTPGIRAMAKAIDERKIADVTPTLIEMREYLDREREG